MKKLKTLFAVAAVAVCGVAYASYVQPIYVPTYDASGNVTGCHSATLINYSPSYTSSATPVLLDGQSTTAGWGTTIWCSGGWLYAAIDESQGDLIDR